MKNLFWQLSLFTICLGCVVGCGDGNPKCIPVSGKVTLDGGKVPGPGTIYFTIADKGGEGLARPGLGDFDADGKYTAKTFAPGDGLLPGKYMLRIECYKTPPNMEGKPIVSFIPSKYENASKSGFELEVKASDRSLTYDVALTSK